MTAKKVWEKFWVSQEDGRDHSAHLVEHGDIEIQWLWEGDSCYQRVRLSASQMDELAMRWLTVHRHYSVRPWDSGVQCENCHANVFQASYCPTCDKTLCEDCFDMSEHGEWHMTHPKE